MPPAPWKVWTALGLVYVVWGSTYLAIAYVVEGPPPLLTAGLRFVAAAGLVSLFVLARRGRAPFRATRRQWRNAALIGVLLLLGGNGGVTLAEDQGLPSGLAALIISAVPLYVVLMRIGLNDRPSRRTTLGVAIGFVGLGLLLLPGTRPDGVPAGAAALVLGCCFLWAVGSVIATRVDLPADALVTVVAEMCGGAVGLLAVGAVRGERLAVSDVTTSSFLAFCYLVVFGSVVAFTAYSWLLGSAPVSKVATYAYVNPVVAVALGALLRGEDLTVTSAVGGAVTVVAVAIVVSEAPSPPVETPDVVLQDPDDLQGRLRSSAT